MDVPRWLAAAVPLLSLLGLVGPSRTPPATAPPAQDAIAFVGSPVVTYAGPKQAPDGGVWVTVAARLSRPLPQGRRGVHGYFDVSGTTADIPGIDRLSGTRRCYVQELYGSPAPHDGDRVTVRLVWGGGRSRHVLRATVPVRRRASDRLDNAALARRLACPRTPPRRMCRLIATHQDVLVAEVGGPETCASGRRVLEAIGRRISTDCWTDLCVHRHPDALGHHCTAAKIGEADWRITCKRGAAVVIGLVSE